MTENQTESDDTSPSREDYLRATAEAFGLNPDAAVAHLDQTLARNREARRQTEKVASFAERVSEQHFPWHYTEFGVLCSCGRPCDGNEDCAVMRRAHRWALTTSPASTPEEA